MVNVIELKNFNQLHCLTFEHFSDKQPFIPSSDSESENEDEIELIRQANLIQKSLLTPATDQALGEWEKHTRVHFHR